MGEEFEPAVAVDSTLDAAPDAETSATEPAAGTLTYPDGTKQVWRVPHSGVVLGAYRDYRWQKLQERLRADDFNRLWEPTARWLVKTKRLHGRRPARVVFTRETKPVNQLNPS